MMDQQPTYASFKEITEFLTKLLRCKKAVSLEKLLRKLNVKVNMHVDIHRFAFVAKILK